MTYDNRDIAIAIGDSTGVGDPSRLTGPQQDASRFATTKEQVILARRNAVFAALERDCADVMVFAVARIHGLPVGDVVDDWAVAFEKAASTLEKRGLL